MNKFLILLIQYEMIFQIYSQSIPQLVNIFGRKKISLNGKWKYIIDIQESGYYDQRMNILEKGFFMNEKPKSPEDLIYDFDDAPEMEIPSDWNTKNEQLLFYEGTIWFKKSFNYTINPQKKLILYFGAVNYESIIYINGILIGKHIGGFTPFNFDITSKIKNGENYIIIKIDNKRKKENIPTLIFDWWNYGGITRDVYLIETNPIYIQNYHFLLNKQNTKQISFKIQLNSKEKNQEIEIIIPELGISEIFRTDPYGNISGILNPKKLILWTPKNPKLYSIILKLGNEELYDKIGFRTIEVQDKKVLLNGNQIFLRGVNVHDVKPFSDGRANSFADAKIILSWVKELGCNFVRLVHYPHNEYMIREAEKEGILVWSELPLYWTISWEDKDTYNNAKYQLNDMILRDINRANVIIWSIANETPRGAARDLFLSNLISYTKILDNSRLITLATEVIRINNKNIVNDTINNYVDIISFNNYYGWYGRVDIENAPKMNWDIAYNKPIIISEFGAGAKYGYHGNKTQRWTEEFQNNIYIYNLQMIEKIDGLVGTVPWLLNDFLSPRRVLSGIQDFYNRKGFCSNIGEKKLAFYTMQKWYWKKIEEFGNLKIVKYVAIFCFIISIIKIWILTCSSTEGSKIE